MAVLKVWWWSFRHLEHRGYVYVWANLCFILTLIPIVTAPAGFAGLVKVSHAAALDRHADLNTFWEGVRENLWRGMLLGAMTVVILIVNVSNLANYRIENAIDIVFRFVWFGAIALWLMMMIYVWPIYYEMRKPTLIGALRNAALMVLLNPGFTLVFATGMLLLMGLSVFLPPVAFLLTFAFAAILGTYAVFNRLIAAGYSGHLQSSLPAYMTHRST